MVNAWHRFIDNVPLRRFAVLALLIWVLYLVRGMLSAILLTFIFTYIVFASVSAGFPDYPRCWWS